MFNFVYHEVLLKDLWLSSFISFPNENKKIGLQSLYLYLPIELPLRILLIVTFTSLNQLFQN